MHLNNKNIANIISVPVTIDYSPFKNCHLIVIDGDQGAGKSTLACELKSVLDGKVIEIDNYILENGAPYSDQINYSDLFTDYSNIHDKKIIMEGVCMLKILSKLKLRQDFLIFSKRIINGCWEYSKYINEKLELPNSKLTREITEYYIDMKPFKQANIIRELHVEI